MGTPRLGPSRIVGALAVAVMVTASCTVESTPDRVEPPPKPGEQVTIDVSSKFTDRELEAFNDVLAEFRQRNPGIEINSVGNQSTEKLTQAIRGGNPPDVAIAVSDESLGQFCSSGAWQDLGPYVERDKLDLSIIPKAPRGYTTFRGTRCALPMLADVYGLYYNAGYFKGKGITRPPRTMSELTDYAKRLTEFNPDGSIKMAGFLPVLATGSNHPWNWAPHWGAQWLDERKRSALGKDPAWERMLRWQRELVEFYGWDNLVRFTAGLGQQFSADNAFNEGQIAMMMDGEYRTSFIDEQAPELDYGTAAFPVDDRHPELYGTALATGSIIGIPKGAEDPGAAWELVRFLSTNTEAQVRLANSLHNVPSTKPALNHPGLKPTKQFQTFLDIFAGGKVVSNPSSPNGNAYMKSTEDFADEWQRGKVDDLAEELDQLDEEIDAAKKLGG